MNEVDEKIIDRLKTKSGQPVLAHPEDFANEVIGNVRTPRIWTAKHSLYLRFAWSAALSVIITLIGIGWNNIDRKGNSDGNICMYKENKCDISEQTLANIKTSINLVEQYKSFK